MIAMGQRSLLLLASIPMGYSARSSQAPLKAQETLLVEQGGAHASEVKQHDMISPPLDPKSDRHFFKTDYPDDFRPTPTYEHLTHFDHPYPVVQDHETYDKDFVKDENADNGEWQAQMEYDVLRNKLRGKQADVNSAYKKEQEEKQQVDELEKAEKQIEASAKEAKENVEKAQSEAEDAQKKEEKLSGEIGGAVGEVKDKMTNLEECQKQLSAAKARLQQLMKKKEERMNEFRKAKEDAAEDKAEEEEEEKDDSKDKDKDLEQKALSLEKEIAEAEEAHKAALKAYTDEKEQMSDAQTRLKAAAERLREYRNKVDKDGGIVRVSSPASSKPEQKSGSRGTLAITPAAWLLLLAALRL